MELFRVLEQVHFIGFGAMPAIVLTDAFTGTALRFQGQLSPLEQCQIELRIVHLAENWQNSPSWKSFVVFTETPCR